MTKSIKHGGKSDVNNLSRFDVLKGGSWAGCNQREKFCSYEFSPRETECAISIRNASQKISSTLGSARISIERKKIHECNIQLSCSSLNFHGKTVGHL